MIVFSISLLNEVKKLNVKIDKVIATGYNTFDAHPIYGYMKKIGLIFLRIMMYITIINLIITHAAHAFFHQKMKKALILVADGEALVIS